MYRPSRRMVRIESEAHSIIHTESVAPWSRDVQMNEAKLEASVPLLERGRVLGRELQRLGEPGG